MPEPQVATAPLLAPALNVLLRELPGEGERARAQGRARARERERERARARAREREREKSARTYGGRCRWLTANSKSVMTKVAHLHFRFWCFCLWPREERGREGVRVRRSERERGSCAELRGGEHNNNKESSDMVVEVS